MINNTKGKIYRLHRKNRKVTLEKIANQTGIAKSNISEFENGKRNLSEDKIHKLYEAIYIDYEYHEDSQKLAEESVLNLNHNFVFGKNFDEIYERHKSLKKYCLCSTSYITWYLGDFLYYLYSNINLYELSSKVTTLKLYADCLDDGMLQIMYDSIGYYQFTMNNYNEALIALKKAIEKSIFETTTAMALYHITMIYVNQGNLYLALNNIKKAKRLFDKELNFHRSIMCSVELAAVHTRLRNYKMSKKINLQCIEAGEWIAYPREKQLITYNNLLWTYLLSEQYDKIISYEKKIQDLAYNDSTIDSYFAYAYWRKGKEKEAKKYLKVVKEKEVDDTGISENWNYFIDAFTSMILNKPYSIIEKKLTNLYVSTNKYFDYDMQLFTLKLLVEYCDKNNEIEKSDYFKTEIIKILEKSY